MTQRVEKVTNGTIFDDCVHIVLTAIILQTAKRTQRKRTNLLQKSFHPLSARGVFLLSLSQNGRTCLCFLVLSSRGKRCNSDGGSQAWSREFGLCPEVQAHKSYCILDHCHQMSSSTAHFLRAEVSDLWLSNDDEDG